MKKKRKNILTDIDVVTVGLVPRGANQEEFFILKEDGGEMMGDEMELLEEEIMEEETEVPEKEESEGNVLDKLAKAIARAVTQEETEKADVSQRVMDAAKKALAALQGVDAPELKGIKAALQALSQGKVYGYPAYGYPKYGYPAPAKKSDDEEEPEEDVAPELKAKLDQLEKANQELAERLAKAEQEAQAERDARRLEMILKEAERFLAIPGKPEEIADTLFWLEKQGEEGQKRAEWLKGVLKAVDNQLVDSNLFQEVGSARTPTERTALEKAEKIAREEGISFSDALLRLTPEEQAELLKERRSRSRGGV